MTAKRPVFRVMKNGYDRFAVDDAIEKYAATVDELEKRITLYQRQAAEDETKIKELEKKYATPIKVPFKIKVKRTRKVFISSSFIFIKK